MARSVQPDASRRVYGYCRVSTAGQADSGISLDEQEHRIRARCHEHSWSIEHVFVDAGISDSTPLNKRPAGQSATGSDASPPLTELWTEIVFV
jgi:hypothetical protein